MIRITAKKDGFRRGGISHPAAATEYPDNKFTPAELEVLKKEPMLVVELVAGSTKDEVLNVAKTVELILAAATLEALETIVANDTRKGVIDAAAKRRQELAAPE
jgi:hypothetical protein